MKGQRGEPPERAEAALLNAVRRAFARVPRPEHFTDYEHCCECAEHDATLRTATPDTIGLRELGNAGYDPICFITVEGFHYYLPALARLAFGRGDAYYLDQLLFHLQWPPERLSTLAPEQRAALRAVLEYVFEIRFDEIASERDREALLDAIGALSD
ncbi:MAG TPA: hypothetical protein VII06_12885 [Chloroflexota bacterium]|jgi:hypothetical protein